MPLPARPHGGAPSNRLRDVGQCRDSCAPSRRLHSCARMAKRERGRSENHSRLTHRCSDGRRWLLAVARKRRITEQLNTSGGALGSFGERLGDYPLILVEEDQHVLGRPNRKTLDRRIRSGTQGEVRPRHRRGRITHAAEDDGPTARCTWTITDTAGRGTSNRRTTVRAADDSTPLATALKAARPRPRPKTETRFWAPAVAAIVGESSERPRDAPLRTTRTPLGFGSTTAIAG